MNKNILKTTDFRPQNASFYETSEAGFARADFASDCTCVGDKTACFEGITL